MATREGDDDAAQQRPSSLRDLVGSDETMAIVVTFLGVVGEEIDERTLGEALALARVVPGVCIASFLTVGPAGASLLATDACLGGLELYSGSSWAHVFAALKLNTGLRALNLGACELKTADVRLLTDALAVNGRVCELDLWGNHLGVVGGRAVAAMVETSARFRVLRLADAHLGEAGGRAVVAAWGGSATGTCLQELNLRANGLGEATGRAIASALTTSTTLRKLNLSKNRGLGDRAWAAIVRSLLVNGTLVELDIGDNALGQESAAALVKVMRENSTLRTLVLAGCSLEGPGDLGRSSWQQLFAALGDNIGLWSLSLGYCDLSGSDGDELASVLQHRPSGLLRELDVGGNRDLGSGACGGLVGGWSLKPGSALRKLDLHGTGLTTVGGDCLAHCLRRYLLGDDGGDVPVPASAPRQRPGGLLRELRELDCLDLGDNAQLGARACIAILAACLQPSSTLRLRELRLSAVEMSRAAGVSLANWLRENCTLQVLDLSYNELGRSEGSEGSEAGGTGKKSGKQGRRRRAPRGRAHRGQGTRPVWQELFASLAVNSGLQSLRLSDCGLTKREAVSLGASLKANRVLQGLGLENNDLGDRGVCALAHGLASNTSLRKLDLTNTSLGDAAAQALANLLQANATLCNIGVGQNRDTEEAFEALQRAGCFASCVIRDFVD